MFVEKGIFRNIFNVDFSITSLIKEFMSYCHPLVVMSVVGLLAGLFEIWLLQTTGGNEQTGFYGLAYSLAAMCFLFTGAMTPLITREFSKSYEQKDLESMQKLFSRYIPMLYSIAAYFAVFISFQSENILAIFTDEQFKNAYWVLVVMAFYPIHQTYGQLSGSIFYATGQTKLYRNISLFLAFVGVLLACLFLYFLELGAIGLAWKMVAVQFVGVNIQLYFNAKLLKLDMKKFLWHQIYSVLFFVTMAFISTMLTPSGVPLVEFFISGFIYTVLVIISTYALPQVFATSRDEMRKNLFKARQYVAKK
ncbi:MAG: hypothetical protein IBX45_12820 [Campylobacterales bacterium]|nr:hypothetical protein [Campylobacterales bacterium]